MTSRGPLPKPAALKMLNGNPGRRPLDLSDGVNPPIAVPSIPKYLSPTARKEWKRITPHLLELGLITHLDVAALASYCQAYGRLVELETAFEAVVQRLLDKGREKSKTYTYAEAVLEASQTTTPSGYAQQSVAVQLLSRQRAEVNRYLGHFGLSPAQRARVQPSNYIPPQATLPGMEEAPAPGGFAQFAADAAPRVH